MLLNNNQKRVRDIIDYYSSAADPTSEVNILFRNLYFGEVKSDVRAWYGRQDPWGSP